MVEGRQGALRRGGTKTPFHGGSLREVFVHPLLPLTLWHSLIMLHADDLDPSQHQGTAEERSEFFG